MSEEPTPVNSNTFSHGININCVPRYHHAHKRRRGHVPHTTATRLRRPAGRRLLRGDDDERLPQFPGWHEHPDVIRDLTKYVDEDDDDDDEDDVEAIAPAPRQAPPAGWGKLLSA